MSTAQVSSGPHAVGGGFTVVWTMTHGEKGEPITAECEWAPHFPTKQGWKTVSRPFYEYARGVFFEKAAKSLGGNILLIDLPRGGKS